MCFNVIPSISYVYNLFFNGHMELTSLIRQLTDHIGL